MSEEDEAFWKRCSACKTPIALGADYYVCNVSTCNRKRTALAFCTVSCWEVHLPIANHREAWAEERRAPKVREAEPASGAPKKEGKRRLPPVSRPAPISSASAAPASSDDVPREVLIIASRLKEYVRARTGYNTSDRVLAPLSDIVRRAVDEAIENARRDERKTVLDRDVPKR